MHRKADQCKMLVARWVQAPTLVSLGVILTVLGVFKVASKLLK